MQTPNHGQQGPAADSQATGWGDLPPSMRVLSIVGESQRSGWLSEVFAGDQASRVALHEAVGMVEGLARLRDERFDTVLICHDPERFNALTVLDAIRTGSTEQQPIIVLGEAAETELAPTCFALGADAYLCLENTTARMLLWHVARARERQQLLEENRQLQQARRLQLKRERDEASRLLREQRKLVESLRRSAGDRSRGQNRGDSPTGGGPFREIAASYREVLQTYVVMGGGNLSQEIEALTARLIAEGIDGPRAISMHLNVLEAMIDELGNRSARHVMNRADMLFIELLVHLCEGFRQKADRIAAPAATFLLTK